MDFENDESIIQNHSPNEKKPKIPPIVINQNEFNIGVIKNLNLLWSALHSNLYHWASKFVLVTKAPMISALNI